jgi:tetratricopeptide (TPR) repeat protein
MRPDSLVAGLVLATAVAAGAVVPLAGQAADGRQLFVAANALYAEQRYAEAAAGYEAALAADPTIAEAHFFLGNAYDNLYRPARRGDPANDRLLDAARANYQLAADRLTGQTPEAQLLRKRTLQFLAAVYGRDKLNRPDDAAAVVRQLIALEPGDPTSYFALVKIFEDAGRFADAETILQQVQAVAPDKTDVWAQTAQFYNRKGDFDRAMAAFDTITRLEPANPQHFYQMAVFYEEKVRKDFTLKPAQVADYLTKGMAAVDKALELRPDYFEALTYKNLLYRQQARLEKVPAKQQELLKKADEYQKKAIEVRDKQQTATPAAGAAAGAKK